jgi:hypothetical protein
MKRTKRIAILLAGLLTAACTLLPLVDEEARMARFICTFSWQDSSAESRPDSFALAILRTYNSVHVIKEVALEGKDTISVAFGEYLALAAGSSPMDAYKLEYFADEQPILNTDGGMTWDPAGLFACIPTMANARIDKLFGGHSWTDPSYAVIPEATPLFLAKTRKELLSGNAVERLELSARDVTQQVSFRISLDTAPGIVIDTLSACITGTPRRIQVISNAVANVNEQLGQTLFRLYPTSSNGQYEGSIRCLGIFPSVNEEYEFSPGILQVHIHAAIGSVSRYLDARINLKRQIEEAGLLADPDGTGYFTIATRQAMLCVETPLVITEDNVRAEGDVYLEWVDHEVGHDENGDPLEF